MVIPYNLAKQKRPWERKKTVNAWDKDKMISTQSFSTIVFANEFTQRHGGRKGTFYTNIFIYLAKTELKHSPQNQDFYHSVTLR